MTVRSPTTIMLSTGKAKTQRQKQKRSRGGCGNCKLRSLKCDETKPHCARCTTYGVLCNYDRSKSDLQLSVEVVPTIVLPQRHPYWLSPDEQLLDKFQKRTAFTVSAGRRLELFQGEILGLACENPPLKHVILTLTLMHDRHLSLTNDTSAKLSSAEAYHWYQATSSFNQQLSSSLASSHPAEARIDRHAALWTTAALLGTLVFAHIEASSPEEAWPLAPPSAVDLDWLKMSDGKMAVRRLAGPLTEDNVFGVLMNMHANERSTLSTEGERKLPAGFVDLYCLDTSLDDRYGSPYQPAASELAHFLVTNPPPVTIILGFWSFVGSMKSDFKHLLQRKDPSALLLLAIWYAKLAQIGVWWISRRTVLEGTAICLYLERYHSGESDVQRLLHFPRDIFAS